MDAFDELVKSTQTKKEGEREKRGAVGIISNTMLTAIDMTGAGVAVFAAANLAFNDAEGFNDEGADSAKEDMFERVSDGNQQVVDAVYEAAKCAAGMVLT